MSKNNTYNKENNLKQSDNNLISDNLIQDEEQFLKEYKSDKKTGLIYFFVVTSLLIGVFLISFNSGRYDMSIVDVINSIISGMKHGIWWLLSHIGFNLAEPTWMSGPEDTIIWLVRMPRIFAAILIGGSLAVSGATYQGLFRNPMVSPDVLGASAGASVGACIMMLFNMGPVMIQIAAFVMGIFAVALSYFLSKTIGKGTNVILLLVLCGMTVNTLFQALVSVTKYLADTEEQLPAMTYWLMGSIAKVSYNDLKFFLIPFGLGVIPIVALRWKLNLLSFGEDEAKAMGIDVSKVRIVCIISATLLTAAVVSIAGTIGWVGLMIPHLVRFISGPNNKTLIPFSLLTGALFMLIVDDFCRTLLAYEIPLGVLTSLIGAPFFIYILFKTRGNA
ncbi:iron ABC transporter permease [Lachnoanaerobaculum sp. Marseille-Q4761]|jgi:ABC transporter, iron chelate uptake transporter family, permease protein|uniref:FecCD family ABC transporter permease n=1 Tax=Lachnoanaerobaculum sp. Marseille-Q4761 TaxID=2819511 RepID=UPI001AA1BC8A|nr:iron ABC transporter permease [Lachnoanaerobaculum sp. Marseille-Q4761]MBO1871503.1 iron ABC transporter permease [Lachnoanaerobaculum sp. Marseille-Q4761]